MYLHILQQCVHKMLSAYPSITNAEFKEASRILEYAYAASLEVSDWVEVKRATGELLIRQKRSLLRAPRASESDIIKDTEQDEVDLDEIEQEDEVISDVLLIVHFSQVTL